MLVVVVAQPPPQGVLGQVSGVRGVGRRTTRDKGRSAAPRAPCRPADPRLVVAQPPQELCADHVVKQEPTA